MLLEVVTTPAASELLTHDSGEDVLLPSAPWPFEGVEQLPAFSYRDYTYDDDGVPDAASLAGLDDVGGASYMYDYDFVGQIDESELDRLPLPSDVDSLALALGSDISMLASSGSDGQLPNSGTSSPAAALSIKEHKERRLDTWLTEQALLAATAAAQATAVYCAPRTPTTTADTPLALSVPPEGTGVLKVIRSNNNKRKAVEPAAAEPIQNDDEELLLRRPFPCTFEGCGYRPTKRRYLRDHARVHSGERPYKCTWPGCTYAAAGQGHIKRHIRTHTGVKPYPCTEPGCTYSASQGCHLRTHMRTHTGERPFQCAVPGCGYAAARSCHLARHMKNHTAAGGGGGEGGEGGGGGGLEAAAVVR